MKHQTQAPIRRWWLWFMTVASCLIIGATALAVSWLLHEARSGPRSELAALRIDAIRTGLAVGAGLAGAIALVIGFRRQWHQETVASDNRHDATERRITELYTKAVEQLGNDKAPVRLGGLYALERLAHNNPEHRQTIVNVICAYLRMPYTPPQDQTDTPESNHPAPDGHDDRGLDNIPSGANVHNAREELEVRLTAQRILANHLRPTTPNQDPSYWGLLRIDLTRATLITPDFNGCHLFHATFTEATFYGALFRYALFDFQVDFRSTVFRRFTDFSNATFRGDSDFGRASFEGGVDFCEATFQRYADLSDATFCHYADFSDVTFDTYSDFGGTIFRGPSDFKGATFGGDATFIEVLFESRAEFNNADFRAKSEFLGAEFAEHPSFYGARATSPQIIEREWLSGWTGTPHPDGGLLLVPNSQPTSSSPNGDDPSTTPAQP